MFILRIIQSFDIKTWNFKYQEFCIQLDYKEVDVWNTTAWRRCLDLLTLVQIMINCWAHYRDVIIAAMASQIISFTIIYSTVYSGKDQRKHISSALLAFVRGFHRWPVNSAHKWPVTRQMFPFDDVFKTLCGINTYSVTLQYHWTVLCVFVSCPLSFLGHFVQVISFMYHTMCAMYPLRYAYCFVVAPMLWCNRLRY